MTIMTKKRPFPTNKSGRSFVEGAFYGLIIVAFVAGLLAGYIVWGTNRQEVPLPRTEVPGQGQAVPMPPTQPADRAQQPTPQTRPAGNTQAPTDTQSTPDEPVRYDVPTDDDPGIGPENAPVTIIEFSDYQCPYCRRWTEQVEKKLLETYGDKLRIVYRDFPLTSIHSEALPAAEAANCAGEQGKYWEYHDALFAQEYGLGEDAYIAYAKDVGLDIDKFTACVDEHRYRDEVLSDQEYALNLGVRSTPTFFINGIPVVGAQPFDVFKSIIDKELEAK